MINPDDQPKDTATAETDDDERGQRATCEVPADDRGVPPRDLPDAAIEEMQQIGERPALFRVARVRRPI